MAGIATAGAALGVTAAIGGLVALGAAAINASAKFEAYRASLTTILGDSDKAAQAFDRLTQFAAATPFSLDQSVEGFIKLKALGLTPSEAALTSYGNTASAMGKDLNQMIEAVADAATGEFERLKEFGIKSKIQGDQVSFTFQGVTTKVANNSKEIQGYLQGIGNVNFAGAMAKQMATFNGATANLSDTVQQTMAKIGDGLNKPIASVINLMTSGLSAVTPFLAGIGNMFGGLISGIASIIGGIGSMFGAITNGGPGSLSLMERLTVIVNVMGEGFQVLGSIIGAVMGASAQIIGGVVGFMQSSFGGVLAWLGVSFETGGRSWGNSIMGVLRAVKAVVGLMPKLFSLAVNDVMRMFRDLGQGIMAFLSGNWSKGISFFNKDQFSNTAKGLDAVGKTFGKVYSDVKGADAAWTRMTGGGKPKGSLSLDQLAGAAPTPTPTSSDKKDAAKKAAEDAAKKAAERIKKENEFFSALDENAKMAAMLPLEAERYNKELELRKILGDGELKDAIQLSSVQREHIQNALALKSTNELIKSAKEAIQGADIDAARIQSQIALATGVTAEKAAENLAVEQKLWPIKQAAMIRGISLADAELARQLSILDAKERQNYQAERANDLAKSLTQSGIDFGKGAVATDGSTAAKKTLAQTSYDQRMKELNAAKSSLSPAEFRAGVVKAGREFREQIADAASGFATRLGGVLDDIGNRIGGKIGAIIGAGGGVATSMGGFAKTAADTSKSIQGLFSNPDSALAKGIGKSVGGAMAGLEIGEKIGGAMKSLGLKGGETGSKIGGAVGGLTGNPLIAAGASVIGGLIGSLFYKAPKGQATITGLNSVAVTGNKKGVREAAGTMAGEVTSGLAKLASDLGGEVGAFRVSIGKYKDDIRVNPTGGVVGGKKGSGAITYKTEAEAVAAAIKAAIGQGAITGLSDLANKALRSLDADGAVSFVQSWNDAMTEFASMTNPVKASIDAIIDPLNKMRETMNLIGASSSDMAKLNAYEAMKMDQLLKEKTKTFADLIESLNGEQSGVTALDRLNADMKKFDAFKSDIAAGKQVDESAFSSLVTKIMGENKDVWGTSTSQSQSIRNMLIDTVNAAERLVRNEFTPVMGGAVISANDNGVMAANDSTANAVNAGNAVISARIDGTNTALSLNNAYQEKILETLQGLAVPGSVQFGTNSRAAQV